jgi:hypothetical protein
VERVSAVSGQRDRIFDRMPVAHNPFGSEAVAVAGAGQEDPWAMYYVVW